MSEQYLLEHRERRLTRRVRHNRYRVALAIAAAEGILVIAGVMPWWLVVLLALVAVGAYAGWGREHESADVRVLTWTAAVSQLLVVLVPVLAGALVVLAAVAVVLLAAVALAAILLDRR
jgi:predicted hotdog family 3-hydroxylacyl-ACP dehydratase